MKKILASIIVLTSFLYCQSQPLKSKLSDNVQINFKDLLDLRLQILAAQMSCKSYSILDLGTLGFPVFISLEDSIIIYKISGDLDKNLKKAKREEIMLEGFVFVNSGITEMIRQKFNNLEFDITKNIKGEWFYEESMEPISIYEHDKFEWKERNKN